MLLIYQIKLYYSYGSKIARFDIIKQRKNSYHYGNFKIIHDFNSGIAYEIDKDIETCEMYPIGDNFPDTTVTVSSDLAAALKIKNPQEMFFLDDFSYFYAGQVFY